MRVFLTGASGFVGSAVLRELRDAGHRVLGLARSEASARSIADAGAEVHLGGLDDPDSLRRGADAADGVIHTAFIHDFTDLAASCRADFRAIGTIGDALAGSGRPFVVTSGMCFDTPGRAGTEADPGDAAGGWGLRAPSEAATLALAARGVRASVLRLPPSVHGDGDYGFVPMLIGVARRKGASAYIGEGLNRWPAVHRLDAARLYRLALEHGAAGSRFHAVDDEGVPTREIAEVIGRRLNLPVISVPPDHAADHFGWFAHFFGGDKPTSGATTRDSLDWRPTQPGLIADLDRPNYFST